MGSLITGALEGITAVMNLFNDGVDQSVLKLGIATEKELRANFGKAPEKVTLLDYLGLKETAASSPS